MSERDKDFSDKAAEEILRSAVLAQGVDLEPTPEELEFLLAEEPAHEGGETFSGEQEILGASVPDRLSAEEAAAEYSAMNRKHAAAGFSDEVEEMLARKRRELFEKMLQRHSQSE